MNEKKKKKKKKKKKNVNCFNPKFHPHHSVIRFHDEMQVTQENLKQNFLLKLPLTIIGHISPSSLLSLSPSLSTKIFQTIIVSQGKWTSGIISTDHFTTSS